MKIREKQQVGELGTDAFRFWLRTAEPGDSVTYARARTVSLASESGDPDARMATAEAAWEAHTSGHVHLTRKKVGGVWGLFDYVAIRKG